jgi:hypothetical protein
VKKVKADKIAHDIAIKARNKWVHKSADLLVQAQECVDPSYADDAKEFRQEAKAAEILAREWERKADLALNPVSDPQVRAMLAKLPALDAESIMVMWGGHLSNRGDPPADYYLPPESDRLIGIFNECVDALTVDPLS